MSCVDTTGQADLLGLLGLPAGKVKANVLFIITVMVL